jgi:hypothetical protein
MSDLFDYPVCPYPKEVIKAEVDRQALALLALKPELEAYHKLTQELHLKVLQIDGNPHDMDEWLDRDILESISEASALFENTDGRMFNMLDDFNRAIRGLNDENQRYKRGLLGSNESTEFNLSKQQAFNTNDSHLYYKEYDDENTVPYEFS